MSDYDYSIHYKRFHDEQGIDTAPRTDVLAGRIKLHLNLPAEARILDIGCGFGFALSALRRLGYENTLGLELSAQQAEIARGVGHTVVVTDDSIEWMRSHPESFDFVLLFDVLEHVPVPAQIDFLRALHTALRPGGTLLMDVPNANAILSSRWRYIDYTHHTSFTEHSLYFVLRNAGFEKIWIDSNKGIGRFPRRLWLRSARLDARRWLVRWWWFQVVAAELHWQSIADISFDLNLTATATKHA